MVGYSDCSAGRLFGLITYKTVCALSRATLVAEHKRSFNVRRPKAKVLHTVGFNEIIRIDVIM